jgi:diguanylate cyclase (GGDEF)-like protein
LGERFAGGIRVLSPFVRAVLIVAACTAVAIVSSVSIIFAADMLLPGFTARFDNYAFGVGIPLAIAPTLIYPLIGLYYRAEKAQSDLDRLVRTDALTGLANRRAFFEYTAKLFGDPRGPSTGPLALMMIDIDHFKRVNDIYGHTAGDDILKRVGHMIREAVRGGRDSSPSLVARVGGEEFAVVLAGMDAVEASAVAERVCRSVRHAGVPVAGELVTTTVSVGVALRLPTETLETTLKAADKAAYDAKRGGRDRWSLAMSHQAGPSVAPEKKAEVPLAVRQKAVQAA